MSDRRPTILVVDQDPTEGAVTALLLRTAFPSMAVLTATRGDEAQERANALLDADPCAELLLIAEFVLPDDDSGLRLIGRLETREDDRIAFVLFTQSRNPRLKEICKERLIIHFHKRDEQEQLLTFFHALLD
ncbi:MAG: hypothetical protein Q7R83_03675 [bacterium]|nr:hypothetical protein [bacterium]